MLRILRRRRPLLACLRRTLPPDREPTDRPHMNGTVDAIGSRTITADAPTTESHATRYDRGASPGAHPDRSPPPRCEPQQTQAPATSQAGEPIDVSATVAGRSAARSKEAALSGAEADHANVSRRSAPARTASHDGGSRSQCAHPTGSDSGSIQPSLDLRREPRSVGP